MASKSLRFLSALCLLLAMTSVVQGRVQIRMGTMVPTGSAWHKILQKMGSDWSSATDGEVRLRIFAGGTAGDEGALIRKMRIGQLQAAAISNAGLTEIDRAAFALMLPLMFESYEEWDYVRNVVFVC